ncbi:MAG: NUDIX hydrolase [Planctomycetota bacterium]|jgi:ADP-ribose pyrophosphatase YjhB (NUDIX family)
MKFYDEREKHHRYRRVAIGPAGKITGCVLIVISLAATIFMRGLIGDPEFNTASQIVIYLVLIIIFLVGLLLQSQKRVTVDLLARKVTAEIGWAFSMKKVAEYEFSSLTAVVVYALKFGVGKTRNLFASAIRTADKKLVIFNPGISDPQENMKIAGILAELLGVPILAGKVSEDNGKTIAVPVALVAIERNNGEEVLLIQRKKPPFEGLWGLPGGKVQEGETAPEAAAREMMEETGYAPKYLESYGIISEEIREEGAPSPNVMIHLFRADAEEIHRKDEVGTEIAWRPSEEIREEPDDIIPSDLRMLNEMIIPRRVGYVKARINKMPGGYVVTRFEFSGKGPELPAPDDDDKKDNGKAYSGEDK